MTRTTRPFAVLLLGACCALAMSPAARAEDWRADHPRRAEVNSRLENQNARIHDERREGEISASQAQALHAQDHEIRTEERAMAGQHDSHITAAEQRALNQQENGVSREIGH